MGLPPFGKALLPQHDFLYGHPLKHSEMSAAPSEVRTIFLALSARADLMSDPLSGFDVLPAVYRLILSMGYQNQVRFVSVVYRFRF